MSVEWYNGTKHTLPRNYHFHSFGAGGVNGHVTLQEYNWNQVSILRVPHFIKNCSAEQLHSSRTDERCPTVWTGRRSFTLPVRTLGKIMHQLGHSRIDVLKVDVEGSEYAFLEEALDSGAIAAVQQLALEWHHYAFDQRYGGGSAPSINALSTVLAAYGLHVWFVQHPQGWTGSETTDLLFEKAHMHDVRYNLASFCRTTVCTIRPLTQKRSPAPLMRW